MKLFGAVICFGVGTIAGIIYYYRHQQRVQFYDDLVVFCERLEQAISFALQPLPEIITAYQPICHQQCRQLLGAYGQLLQSKTDITRAKCQALVTDTNVAEFLYQLGRLGPEEEQQKIAAARTVFMTQKNQATQYLQTKASIISKLLIIMGIAGGILWM